ncbi:MAG: hypothetical protein K0S47_538 [Herbinix sp.]|jgi:DnaD/phage-associated family protein|nr:hypothetical protein [Herbinix sp.]
MNKITLHAEGINDVTIIPNTFIDHYMPSANGAYVKVYLYLLRSFHGKCPEVTISSIADRLDNTEKDVIRALNYWEKLQLLSLGRNSQKEIISIHLTDLNNIQNTNETYEQGPEQDEIAASLMTPIEIPATRDNIKQLERTSYRNIPVDIDADDQDEMMSASIPEYHEKVSSAPVPKSPAPRQTYSAEKTAQLTNNDEIKWIMHIVEIYLDKPLKTLDIQLILYLYEELHFSAELIMYLYEYCVSKGKKNVSYIEAVALTWAEDGIDTEEKAKEATATYNDHYNAVSKAFGLNRLPGQIERQYISKWIDQFGFSDEIITEACNRTILRTQKPDFKYTDKILETWFKKGAKSLADISRLDEEFTKGHKHQDSYPKVTPPAKPSTNKFNQFPQRTYSAQDYADLERKLLNKGL